MSETKWTPGPWAVVRFREGTLGQDPATMRERIAVERLSEGNRPDERIAIVLEGFRREEEADAHLIAAAPDLYEALSRVLAHVTHEETTTASEATKDAMRGIAKFTRAALAKARGETP